MVIRHTHHFLQILFALLVAYLLVARLIVSWIQHSPEQVSSVIQSFTQAEVTVGDVKVEQDWLGFSLELSQLSVKHAEYELYLGALSTDINLFSLLVPMVEIGHQLSIQDARFASTKEPSQSPNRQASVDNQEWLQTSINQFTEMNADISRLWKRVNLGDLVLSRLSGSDFTLHIHRFQSLKGARVSIASEFSLAYPNVLNYERFRLQTSFKPNLWGGVEKGELSLVSFEPLRIESLQYLLPEVWHAKLPRGEVIGDFSASVVSSNLANMSLKLNSQSLRWSQQPKGEASLPSNLGIELDWSATQQRIGKQGWRFELTQLQIDNQYLDAVSPIQLDFEGGRLTLNAERFDIMPLKPIVAAIFDDHALAPIFGPKTELSFENLHVLFDWKKFYVPKFTLQLQSLIVPETDFPGIQAEKLTIIKEKDDIVVQTSSPVLLSAQKFHKGTMQMQIPLGLSFQYFETNKVWAVDRQSIMLDEMPFEVTLRYFNRGEIDLNMQFNIPTMLKLKQYLPYGVMAPSLQTWLQKALVDGRNISGNMVVKGKVADFPFRDQSGLFEVLATIDKAYLKFHPDWPMLQNFTGNLHFTPFNLKIASERIYLGSKVDARDVVVDIRTMDQPNIDLLINGTVSTHFDRAMDYLTTTPLAKALQLEELVTESAFGGEIVVNLDEIRVPIVGYAGLKETVKGSVQFNNANMRVMNQLPIEKMIGRLEFTEKAIQAKKIQVDIFDGKGEVSVGTDLKKALISIDGNGLFLERNKQYFDHPLPWKASVEIPFKRQGDQSVSTMVDVDFNGAKSLLPAPLDASALANKTLNVELSVEKELMHLHAKIPDLAYLEANWSQPHNGQSELQNIQFLFGKAVSKPAGLSVNDSYVNGHLESIDVQGWAKVSQQWDVSKSSTDSKSRSRLFWKPSNLRVDALNIGDQSYSSVVLDWQSKPLLTEVAMRSPDVAAKMLIRPNEPVELLVEHLTIYAERMATEDATDEIKKAAIQQCKQSDGVDSYWPELIFRGKNIQIDQYKINALNFKLTDDESMQVMSSMHGVFGGDAGELSGQYLFDKQTMQSKLALSLKSKQVAVLTEFLQIEKGFSGKKGALDVNLAWQGGLKCFATKSANGNLAFELHDGVIEDVEPGFARVIGLLSVESLARRLQLDLKDLAYKGLVYDRIKGAASIENGLLSLNSFKLSAPSASVGVFGQIDLLKENFALQAEVTPAIGASIPTIAALAGYANPLAALAVYTVMKAIPEVNENLITYRYDITGPWTKPVITGVEQPKVQKEVLPVDETILDLQ